MCGPWNPAFLRIFSVSLSLPPPALRLSLCVCVCQWRCAAAVGCRKCTVTFASDARRREIAALLCRASQLLSSEPEQCFPVISGCYCSRSTSIPDPILMLTIFHIEAVLGFSRRVSRVPVLEYVFYRSTPLPTLFFI